MTASSSQVSDRSISTEDRPILYSFRRCPYAMRARLAVAASQYACELREIVLRDKAPEFLVASPKGTVPVMVVTDGYVLEESLDIMNHVLGCADPENWMQPETGGRAEMDQLIAECDGPFKTALDRYKYPNRYEAVDIDHERNRAGEFLKQLEQRLAATQYLFGNRFSFADAAILPFVRQFAHVDREWFGKQDWPNVLRWLDEFLTSERFKRIMVKYPKWERGDAPTDFPG